MMNSLFSPFNPSSWLFFPLNWLILLFLFSFWPHLFFFWKNPYLIWGYKILSILKKEFSKIMGSHSFPSSIWLVSSLFMFLFMMNVLSLFPFIFTPSSHLVMTLWFSLSLWTSFFLYNLKFNFKLLLAHLSPEGSPNYLAPFMVLIETISLFIRPMTLAIRLGANMIAGHLLLSLLGNSLFNLNWYLFPLWLLAQMALFTLESAVAIIQAYVFSLLVILYSLET